MKGFYILLLTLVAAGTSKADLGEIETFEVVDQTQTSITLKWSLGPSDQPPVKYTLVEDSWINTDVQCTAPCTHKFEFLEPCTEHKFTVTPFYLVNGAPVQTNTAEVNGSTQGTAPDAPTSLVAVDHNHNADITWTPPANTDCLDHWQVCYKVQEEVNNTCETTNLNSITLHGLEKCAVMQVHIRGVTPDGVYGKALSGHFDMGYGEPSEVEDLVVGQITNDSVELKFNDPKTNHLCVEKYSIDYGQNKSSRTTEKEDYDNHATISDLNGCTPYQFDVSPISKEGFQGGIKSVTAETLESYPLDITDIHVDFEKDPGALVVSWGKNTDDLCQSSWKICYHDEINPADNCYTTDGVDGESFEISLQVEACMFYDVGVSGVSPSGLVGNFVWNRTWTWDEVPSAVQDLTIESTDVNVIEISFTDPADNARCVDGYDITINDLETKSVKNDHHDYFFTELEACTDYEISVIAYTRDGSKSPGSTCQGTTHEGPVSAPRQFSTHDNEVTETSISLVWYEPSINSRCTGKYQLSWTGSGDGSVEISNGSYQVIYTVDDLVCGGEYDFTLEVFSLSGGSSSDSPITYHAATLPCP